MRDSTVQRAATRKSLSPRREPYWRQLAPYQQIGFRKMPSGSETWIAKWRRNQRSLGPVGERTYTEAVREATAWFKSCQAGVVRSPSVTDACRAYVASKEEKRRADPESRFNAMVYAAPIGQIKLDKLRPTDIDKWRDGLLSERRGPTAVNRTLRTFKAALNYAFKRQMVASDTAWRVVDPLPFVDGKRERILSLAERRSLIQSANKDLSALLQGLLCTAARPTELMCAKVSDLDLGSRTLRLVSHKGRGGIPRARTVPLPPAVLSFMKTQTRGKTPAAYLFTDSGKPWHRSNVSRQLRRIAPPGVVAYTMRHTTISEWLAAGVDIATVGKLAGTSILMIDKYYHKYVKTDVEDQLASICIC